MLPTALRAVLKFVAVLLFSVFVIDFIGRRRSLMTGIALQIGTPAYVGAYLGVTNGCRGSVGQIEVDPQAVAASRGAIAAIHL